MFEVIIRLKTTNCRVSRGRQHKGAVSRYDDANNDAHFRDQVSLANTQCKIRINKTCAECATAWRSSESVITPTSLRNTFVRALDGVRLPIARSACWRAPRSYQQRLVIDQTSTVAATILQSQGNPLSTTIHQKITINCPLSSNTGLEKAVIEINDRYV